MTTEGIDEAGVLFTRTWQGTVSRFGMIASFRSVAELGLPSARDRVIRESMEMAYEIFNNPEYNDIFLDKARALEHEGGLETLGQKMAAGKLDAFRTAVDAASLVFGHSVLDGAAFDYCRATALASPASWEQFVDQKKIAIRDIRGSSYEQILKARIDEYLTAFERESLLAKIDRLFALCPPTPGHAPMRDYRFDLDRLERLDANRHTVVHGGPIAAPLPDGDDDVLFLMDTTTYLMILVNRRFGLRIDPWLDPASQDRDPDP